MSSSSTKNCGFAAIFQGNNTEKTQNEIKKRMRQSTTLNKDTKHRQRVLMNPPPPPPPQIINPSMTTFLFLKPLNKSDVSSTGRVVIPKKEAEAHLPALQSEQIIWLNFYEMDFPRVWTFRYRFWINNSSRMYVMEHTRDFVSEHKLELGDYFMIYRDNASGSLVIKGQKLRPPPPPPPRPPASTVINYVSENNISLDVNDPVPVPAMNEYYPPIDNGNGNFGVGNFGDYGNDGGYNGNFNLMGFNGGNPPPL